MIYRALGPDWQLGADGLRWRQAARVIVLDDADRVLLIRGHDADRPSRSWWFTPGGGIEPGESPRAAALRELREETGIRLDDGALVGPVFTRSAVFDFFAERCRQDEQIFLARTTAQDPVASRDTWTPWELELLDDVRWWTPADLAEETIEVFPEGLAGLVRGLLDGWDGVARHLAGGEG